MSSSSSFRIYFIKCSKLSLPLPVKMTDEFITISIGRFSLYSLVFDLIYHSFYLNSGIPYCPVFPICSCSVSFADLTSFTQGLSLEFPNSGLDFLLSLDHCFSKCNMRVSCFRITLGLTKKCGFLCRISGAEDVGLKCIFLLNMYIKFENY